MATDLYDETKPPCASPALTYERAAESIVATVLYHADARRIGETATLLDATARGEAQLSRTVPVFRREDGAQSDVLRAPELSHRVPLVLRARGDGGVTVSNGEGGMLVAIDGEKLGTPRALDANDLARGVVVVLGNAVVLMVHALESGTAPLPSLKMVGASKALRELRAEVARVADRDVPILLRGETGVGKELVAAAIHELSPRANRPYVCVNMAAIPPLMAEGELFGYRRGAFTGATRDGPGYFALAEGGTLFLDEIGDAPSELQSKLLRATEHREIQPLGGQVRRVDVRLIAATDSDLESAIAAGSFRRPLLERLGGYKIRIPPLRERRDDIPRLFMHFLKQELAELGQLAKLSAVPDEPSWLPIGLMLELLGYPWPGNVRELANTARQLAITNRDSRTFRLNESLSSVSSRQRSHPPPTVATSRPNDEELIATLRRNAFNLSRTAAELNVSRTTLYTRMDGCTSLRKASDLGADEIQRALATHDQDIKAAAQQLEVSDRGLAMQIKRLNIGRR